MCELEKDLEGTGHCLIPYCPKLRGKTHKETMKILGPDRLCPTRDSDWRPSEYKHRVVLLEQTDRRMYVVEHAEYVKLVVLSYVARNV